MEINIKKLLKEYLSQEYTEDEIESQLATAQIEMNDTKIKVMYASGVVENLVMDTKIVLIQESCMVP